MEAGPREEHPGGRPCPRAHFTAAESGRAHTTGTAVRKERQIGMTSPSDYFRYAQQYARLASDDKCQDYRDALIEMAAVLTRLGWLEFQSGAEAALDTEVELRLTH